jgi:hypothetical protein
MTIGCPFGVGPLSSLNKGFGDFEIWWSRFDGKSPRHLFMNVRPHVGPLGFGKADRRAACGAEAEMTALPEHVRSSLNSGPSSRRVARLKRANTRSHASAPTFDLQ